jgi:uncharacterized protein YuzE
VKIEFDADADAAYIRLSDAPVSRTEEQSDVCVLDLDARGGLVGVELLSVFGFAGASLHSLNQKGLLSREAVDDALAELRRDLVAA